MRILLVILCLTGVSLYAADKPQSGEYQKKTNPERKKLVKATLTQAACFENVGEGALFLVHAGISPDELFDEIFDDEWKLYCSRLPKKARQQTDQSSLA